MNCYLYGVEEVRLAQLERGGSGLAEFLQAPALHVALDESWPAVQFLLSRIALEEKLAFLSAGGRGIPGTDSGFGTARYFTSAEVRAMQGAVGDLSEAALLAGFDRLAREGGAEPSAAQRESVRQTYERCRVFLAGLANTQRGLILRLD
jgi:hypothetical protein